MVSLNILRRGYVELLQPLDYYQAAPVGFLWAVKSATHVLGSSEEALRLYPLLAGISAMLLFAWLAARLLPGFEAAIVTFAFAVSDALIFYSAEVKQYSADVMVALLVTLLALEAARRSLNISVSMGIALLGMVLVWVSHAAIFTLAAATSAMVVDWWRTSSRSRMQLIGWLGIGGAWALSFVLYYLTSLRDLGSVGYLVAYWRDQGAFAPMNSSASSLDWLGGIYLRFFANPVGLWLPSLAAALFLLGAIALIQEAVQGGPEIESQEHDPAVIVTLLLAPILLALAASWMGRYPFKDRLILHLVPAALLLIGFGLLRLRHLGGQYGYWVAGAAAALLLVQPAVSASQALVHPRTGQEFRAAFEIMNSQLEAGDIVYIYERAGPQSLYYLEHQGLRVDDPTVTYRFGTSREGKWENHQQELDTLRGNARVWVVFPTGFHVRDGLNYFDQMGALVGQFETPGVELYLYDLSDS